VDGGSSVGSSSKRSEEKRTSVNMHHLLSESRVVGGDKRAGIDTKDSDGSESCGSSSKEREGGQKSDALITSTLKRGVEVPLGSSPTTAKKPRLKVTAIVDLCESSQEDDVCKAIREEGEKGRGDDVVGRGKRKGGDGECVDEVMRNEEMERKEEEIEKERKKMEREKEEMERKEEEMKMGKKEMERKMAEIEKERKEMERKMAEKELEEIQRQEEELDRKKAEIAETKAILRGKLAYTQSPI